MISIHSELRLMRLAARSAARRATPAHATMWRDDIEQDVLLAAWQIHRRGFGVTREAYGWLASDAVRRYVGDPRSRGRSAFKTLPLEEATRVPVAARHELGPLCMLRLRALWETFTETQKAGLFSLLVDDGYGATGDAADAFGVSLQSINSARKRALERIDNPGAFSRKAKVGVRQLSDADRKAYSRASSKRFRAKRRAAQREAA